MWHFNYKNQQGFTLVEFLIVILIIGVLSTLAVNGYTQYRKSALLELSADNLISQIYELREKTIRGDFGSERYEQVKDALDNDDEIVSEFDQGEAKCFGITFEGGELSSFEANFVGKKVYDSLEGWIYQGCSDSVVENLRSVALGDQVIVEEVVMDDELAVNDFSMRFLPPNGDLEVVVNGVEASKIYQTVKFRIRYEFDDNPNFKRDILIDFNSLNAEVNEAA